KLNKCAVGGRHTNQAIQRERFHTGTIRVAAPAILGRRAFSLLKPEPGDDFHAAGFADWKISFEPCVNPLQSAEQFVSKFRHNSWPKNALMRLTLHTTGAAPMTSDM